VDCPYQALEDYVLIQRIEEAATEINGIAIPDAFQKKSNKAIVISVGRGRIVDGHLLAPDLVAGDIVLFTRYGGQDTELDDEDYIIVRSAEIMLKGIKKTVVV